MQDGTVARVHAVGAAAHWEVPRLFAAQEGPLSDGAKARRGRKMESASARALLFAEEHVKLAKLDILPT